MIEVKRYDYPAKTITYKNGRTKTTESWHECYYYHNGKEVANYDSRYDTIYLATRYISKDRKMSYYDRALNGEYNKVYLYLFDMLGVDNTSELSEFENM